MTEKKAVPNFVIDAALTIKWPVTVCLPADGGGSAEYEFIGIFKRLPEDELDKVMGIEESRKLKALPEIKPDDDGELLYKELIHGEPFVEALPPIKSINEVLRDNAERLPQLLVGWEQVKNSVGDDADFSAEILRAQILGANGRFLSIGLWRAVNEIRSGARLGN